MRLDDQIKEGYELQSTWVTGMVTCVGTPNTIVKGSATVMIGFLPAARMGDPSIHGGAIVLGVAGGDHWWVRPDTASGRPQFLWRHTC